VKGSRKVGRVTFEVVDGCIRAPVFEEREGGRNWAALIFPQRSGPSEREFLDHGAHPRSIASEGLRVGEALEFGADLLEDGPKGGKGTRRTKRRWYGVIRGIEPHAVTVEPFEDEAEAIAHTERARAIDAGETTREAVLPTLARLRLEEQQTARRIRDAEAKLALLSRAPSPASGTT
jgi:hypothetical protein